NNMITHKYQVNYINSYPRSFYPRKNINLRLTTRLSSTTVDGFLLMKPLFGTIKQTNLIPLRIFPPNPKRCYTNMGLIEWRKNIRMLLFYVVSIIHGF